MNPVRLNPLETAPLSEAERLGVPVPHRSPFIFMPARTDLLRQKRRKKKEESSTPQFIICFPFLSAADVLTGAGISHFNLADRICMSFSRVSLSINWFEIADLEDLKPIKSSGENVETALGKMQNVFAIFKLLGPPQHLAMAGSPRCRNSQRFPGTSEKTQKTPEGVRRYRVCGQVGTVADRHPAPHLSVHLHQTADQEQPESLTQ